jgi:hypothetical protein
MMATQTINRDSPRLRSPRRDCCEEECASGSRNNYFLGKQLTPDSYLAEQHYSIERRRLINRAIHGWGVVYGFGLGTREDDKSLAPGEMVVRQGFALDLMGRELIQVCETRLSLDNLLVLDEHQKPLSTNGKLDDRLKDLFRGDEDCWLLRIHYAERKLGEITIQDPCRCDREEWDRTCETVVYSLERIDCEKCCEPWECDLECCCPPNRGCCGERRRKHEECACEHEKLSREFEERVGEFEDDDPGFAAVQKEFEPRFVEVSKIEHSIPEKRHPRGGCSCLCEHLTKLKLGASCVRLCDVGDCTKADLGHGVSLACIKLGRDECGNLVIDSVLDACGPRRLVKRNDLLFDLINGCDVTRIVDVGWARWHRRVQPVPFDDFVTALGGKGDTDVEEVDTVDFWVRFSRPVRVDTLTRDVFTMVVMSDQTEGCWREYYRVPILAVRTSEESDDLPGYAERALVVVSGAWLSDGVLGRGSVFRQGETHVEIEVRGDLIEDCLGQTVDANARGRSPFPTGSDGPGDTYISAFTVARRTREAEPEPRQGYRSRQRTTAAA